MQQDNYTDQYSTITKNMFKKFKRAFFGHFHFHQEQDNCMYISSPFQSKHGDEQGEHGFVFYDTETDVTEFVRNKFSPQFKTITLDKDNVKELLNSKNHFWRIYHQPGMSRDVLRNLSLKILENNYDVKLRPIEEIKGDFKIPVIQEWKDIVHKDADDILLDWWKDNKDTLPIVATQDQMFSVFK